MGAGATIVIVALLAGIALVCGALALVFIVELARLPGIRPHAGNLLYETPANRAEALLLDTLDEREYQQLEKRGYLDVRSPKDEHRVYRIPAFGGLVQMYQHGVASCQLCVRPEEPLPCADVIVMHKLMIEGDEQEYLRRARLYQPLQSNLRYRP